MPGGRKRRDDPLARYRARRSAESTPEPFSGESPHRPGLFVVHKHAARQLHYDLRLEMGGVLQSWAVPKGPSLDPAEKRLAMKVEEHPLEYADFEGVIPEGNYGAGASIVWDRGRWVSIGDPEEGLQKGKLLFDLSGYKLKGRWTLFRTRRSEKDWLLMKKPDAHADTEGGAPLPEASVLSNMTVEDLKEGKDPARRFRSALKRLGAARGPVDVESLEVMLARPRDEPFSRAGWLFELKYDGYQLLAARRNRSPLLRYRRGMVVTDLFPEIAVAVGALPYEGVVLDGEVVVLDDAGKPSFAQLQKRVHLSRRADIVRASVHSPATLFVFDLLALEGFDLRALPLIERKKLLERLLPQAGPLRYSDHLEERGEEMFGEVERMGHEAIVAKRAGSRYESARSDSWQKIRVRRTGDFVVVGYSAPGGSRTGFGALHLAVTAESGLIYAGRVGTGFDAGEMEALHARLRRADRKTPPCTGDTPRGDGHTWVEPFLVCEVAYREWTRDGHLRHPAFVRLREDKEIDECRRQDGPGQERTPPPPASVAPPERKTLLSNLDKIFWPEEHYTKGDLITYYQAVADWILPYLVDRPVVLTRYPDGIEGKNFFQKDAPAYIPDWIRTERMWSEHASREIRYFICDDVETLTYLANMATIPLHIWSSRVATLPAPDWCILDLDPKQAPFAHVVRLARALHDLCAQIDLDAFIKTSGATGLHVLIPLGRQCTYEQSRLLGQVLARVLVAEHPEIATTARSLAARKGRVYIDYLQNGHGRLLVSPFCVRPLPAATVSTPLRWSEVNGRLDVTRFTIRSVPRRLARLKGDPLRPVLERTPDLPAVLSRLAQRQR